MRCGDDRWPPDQVASGAPGDETLTALLLSLSDADAATASLVGPKAATLAKLQRAGLSVPDAVCLTAEAYRARVAKAGVGDAAAGVAGAELFEGRKLALKVRLALLHGPLESPLAETLAPAYAR